MDLLKPPSHVIAFDTPNRGSFDNFSHSLRDDHKAILGRGAYGVVFRASYKNRDVAVKVLEKSNYIKYRSLKQEANILNLNHENIIRILKIVDCEGYGAVIMERCDGSDLQHILDSYKIDLLHRLYVLSDIAKALAFCHSNKIIHLDLKPLNVLVAVRVTGLHGRSYMCKLFDFGCSMKMHQSESFEGLAAGATARYCAPEVLQNQEPDCSADIFSFAIIMWQMKENELPYSSISANETVIWNVVRRDLRPDSLKLRFLCDGSKALKRPRSSIDEPSPRSLSESSFLQVKAINDSPITPKSLKQNLKMLPENAFEKIKRCEKFVFASLQKNQIMKIRKEHTTRKKLFDSKQSPTPKIGDYKDDNNLQQLFTDRQPRSKELIALIEEEYGATYRQCWSRDKSERHSAAQIKNLISDLIESL